MDESIKLSPLFLSNVDILRSCFFLVQRGSIPKRYTNRDRPANAMFTIFDFAKLNDTLFPGCDYPPAMQNSSACSVLLLVSLHFYFQFASINRLLTTRSLPFFSQLYFIPEIRSAIVNCQRRGIIDGKSKKQNKGILDGKYNLVFDSKLLIIHVPYGSSY